ncbi:MAG: prepilin-type N-terminal cleavage/methylation domain-containing protein, partial [Rivularia sp. ALOHA_DT_140]|nr:prepilin-type N-terminal cleavage/methylation domain-containing protein [Rivularia sp. ALOHA_DT_140]
MLYKLPIKVSSTDSKKISENISGFTLIEVLVVIAMVGILSAIAAPSWLGFVARQRLNKAN